MTRRSRSQLHIPPQGSSTFDVLLALNLIKSIYDVEQSRVPAVKRIFCLTRYAGIGCDPLFMRSREYPASTTDLGK
jgi:hypothetical protein